MAFKSIENPDTREDRCLALARAYRQHVNGCDVCREGVERAHVQRCAVGNKYWQDVFNMMARLNWGRRIWGRVGYELVPSAPPTNS